MMPMTKMTNVEIGLNVCVVWWASEWLKSWNSIFGNEELVPKPNYLRIFYEEGEL